MKVIRYSTSHVRRPVEATLPSGPFGMLLFYWPIFSQRIAIPGDSFYNGFSNFLFSLA